MSIAIVILHGRQERTVFLDSACKAENRSVTGVKIASSRGMNQLTPMIFGYVLPERDANTPQILRLKPQVISTHFC